MRPSIDHTMLSPSGRVSKRAREAALRREAARLFPPGYWDEQKPTEAEKRAQQALTLRRTAATLRDLAARGVKPKAYVKQAEAFERQAAALEVRDEV